MSYHIMAELAKKRISRAIDAAYERELAAHREAFRPKPAPSLASLIREQLRTEHARQCQDEAMRNCAQQMQDIHGAQRAFYQGNQYGLGLIGGLWSGLFGGIF